MEGDKSFLKKLEEHNKRKIAKKKENDEIARKKIEEIGKEAKEINDFFDRDEER